MGNKEKDIANDTLHILEQGYYFNAHGNKVDLGEAIALAKTGTQLYTPEALEQLPSRLKRNAMATVFETTHETTMEAILRLQSQRPRKVVCLNFASARKPGGGFLSGSVAQEESLARSSALYPCLLSAEDYYKYHEQHRSGLYSDHMIFSPAVPFFKKDDGQLTDEPYYAGVITSAAVNVGSLRQNEPESLAKTEAVMRVRIRKMLSLAAVQGYEYLVLGAWGCGVFQNDPEMIAELFREKLTDHFAACFRHIVFAIKTNDDQVFQPFQKRFSGRMYYLMY